MAVALLLGTTLPARSQTILRLSDTESVAAHPDELAASLRAEAVMPSAVDAQRKVNAMMADALDRAHAVPGIVAATGSYTVWRTISPTQDHSDRWQAGQSLELHATDGAALLTLVGDLQQRGLAVGHLAWRLSDANSRKAREEALAKAVTALRGRADHAASLLGLQFDSFKEVRLDTPAPQPMPRMMMMAARAADAAPPPPRAEAEDIQVTATADADVLLKPR